MMMWNLVVIVGSVTHCGGGLRWLQYFKHSTRCHQVLYTEPFYKDFFSFVFFWVPLHDDCHASPFLALHTCISLHELQLLEIELKSDLLSLHFQQMHTLSGGHQMGINMR